MPLDADTIQRLMQVKAAGSKPRHNVAPQIGPLRYIEVARRCTKRGCGVMGNWTVQGSPKCSIHALEELNEICVSAGFKGVTTSHTASPTPVPAGRVCGATTIAKLDVGFALSRFECIHGINLEAECGACNGCNS